MSDSGTVTVLRRYPVKSMLGEELETASLASAGIEGDRTVAVIDSGTGNVATAKHPKLWKGLLGLAAEWNEGKPLITLPDGATISVSDPVADGVLSGILGRDVRLETTRPDGAVVGRPDPEDVIESGDDADVPYRLLQIGLGTPGTNFVDFAPVHLITTATLARVGMETIRYRPNLVIDTGDSPAFAENDWTGREITIGDVRLLVITPTPRCAVPTLAHGPLPRRTQAVRVLLEHNRLDLRDFGRVPCLGAYAQVLTPGTIALGDRVSIG
jgi:uncharacterized protein YcbX